MKKIVLVSIGVSSEGFSQFARFLPTTAIGLYYIAAILRITTKYSVEIIDQPVERYSDQEVQQKIDNLKPDYVFFNQFFNTREKIKKIISNIVSTPVILVGGHDATFHSQTLEKDVLQKEYAGIDYIWQGETERDLLSELPHLTKQLVPSIIKKLNRRVNDLNELPILEHTDYPGSIGFLSTSRGCFRSGCDICTTPSFYATGWKDRSVDHVKKEILALQSAGKKFVFICDDNFLGFTERDIQRGHDIIMQCKKSDIKVMIMTTKEQLLKALEGNYLPQWTGVLYRCFVGIESGGIHVRDKIGKITNPYTHKNMSEKVIQQLYANGIGLFIGWINFKPDSTFDELEQDAKFLFENGAECAIFTNLCQNLRMYEGTKIYNKHKHRNIVVRAGEFDYDFDIPEIGKLYRFLMFHIRNETTNRVDNLIFELTDLIYIEQLHNTKLGQEYWQVRNCINKNNYIFFMQCLSVYKKGYGNIDEKTFINTIQKFILQLLNLKKRCEVIFKRRKK